ncbi:MAG: hypothetical protein ACOVQ0_19070 [Novosphingobium sp.]|uniref:hypothetical protein n=1 Tax=Novosphingobium sp. TaxID=1874826 RepID=UPI003B9A7032
MIDDIVEASQRSVAKIDDLKGKPGPSAGKPILPEIIVRREWLPAKAALSFEAFFLVTIVTLAISQAVWAVV